MGESTYSFSDDLPKEDDIIAYTSVFDSVEYLSDSDQWVVIEVKDNGRVTVKNKAQHRIANSPANNFYLIYRASDMANDGKSLGYYKTPLVKAQLYDVVVFYKDQALHSGMIESLSGYLHQTADVRIRSSNKRVEVPVSKLILISRKLHETPFDTNKTIQDFQSRTLSTESVERKELDKCCKYVNIDALPQIHDRVVFETTPEEDEYYDLHFPSGVAKIRDISNDGKTAELELPVNCEKDFIFTIAVNKLYYVGNRKPKHD